MVNTKVLAVVAALACIPAGFVLPLVFGLKGLEVWPVAVCIWAAGVVICVSEIPKVGPLRSRRLFALWINAGLAILFLVGYLLTGGVTLH